ncbi:putative homeobox-leucine zipper protein ATHB-13-like [Capsicum annuum]|nr:putative homeobox-leucine zipper protein ATHB-13-like [Capsicum annuum]
MLVSKLIHVYEDQKYISSEFFYFQTSVEAFLENETSSTTGKGLWHSVHSAGMEPTAPDLVCRTGAHDAKLTLSVLAATINHLSGHPLESLDHSKGLYPWHDIDTLPAGVTGWTLLDKIWGMSVENSHSCSFSISLQSRTQKSGQSDTVTHLSKELIYFGEDVHLVSILAQDVDSGEIACATMLGGYCVFYFTCLIPKIPDCPPEPNLDADFRHVVMTAKKSAFAWALDRNTCHIVWVQQDRELGERSTECRHRWDAKFTQNIVNADSVPFPLALSTQTTAGRGWVASDASTGDTLWTTANPSNDSPHGPVNIVNGILFAGSVPPNGPPNGFDANTGKILWSFNTGATVYAGSSISYGCV